MSQDGEPAAVMMDGVPFVFVGRDEITTIIDVSEHLEAKLQGIRCHATQVGRSNRFADTPDEVMHETWFRQESFVLAHSTVGWPQEIETDLFRGLGSLRVCVDDGSESRTCSGSSRGTPNKLGSPTH